ncbi:MAG: glutamate--tRNA ligase [Candidatus Xenobia bacterium]
MRVRFAPSPTGYLHVGGLRTALYNYLWARREGGRFILRIEDTDRSRLVEGAVQNLIQTLHWAGLTYDEGPDKGGPHAPYVQSERLDLYRKHAQMLLDAGHAYYCFCTSERLEQMRAHQTETGQPPRYDRHCLGLSPGEIKARLGEPHVVRMKIPSNETIGFHDLVRGAVEFHTDTIDDQVLLKSDGYPTYHLANVVDDHDMQITHVIRGEEWLTSTPKHLLLYRFFGWKAPTFAHLPLLLNPDGSKLSKRQGDVAVEDYRDKGYLPQALVNFVALLGWNPGTDEEVFSLDELIMKFSMDRVNKSGSVFDVNKLKWMNGQHVRRLTNDELVPLVVAEIRKAGFAMPDDATLLRIIELMKERVTLLPDFVLSCPYFYADPESYDADAVKKRWKDDAPGLIEACLPAYEGLSQWTAIFLEEATRKLAGQRNVSAGKLIHPLRLAVSGMSNGPGLFELLEVLGRDTVLRRLRRALERLGQPLTSP